MRKILVILVLIIAAVGGYYFYKNFVETGFIKVAFDQIAPPSKEIKEFFEKGGELRDPLKVPAGFKIGLFADLETGKPRVLALDPNGVLVTSITNEGRIVAMPDKNHDGVADEVVNIISGLDRPHGILFYDQYIYIAETNKVSRYFYDAKSLTSGVRNILFDLPSGGGHYTRTIKMFDNKLYTSIGSTCNVCTESDQRRAAIYVSDPDGKNLRAFATGLRNTVFFTQDKSGNIWGNDMGRDLLGDNLPPDELNIIQKGDYGWPYCYGNKIRDNNFIPNTNSNYCDKTIASVFNYPAHVAPLGLAFINSPLFDQGAQGDLLASFHGSWNSSVAVGYKVVKLNIEGNRAVSSEDFITGFLPSGGDENSVLGRPVDLLFDSEGYLYVSDDKAGLIYIVSKDN